MILSYNINSYSYFKSNYVEWLLIAIDFHLVGRLEGQLRWAIYQHLFSWLFSSVIADLYLIELIVTIALDPEFGGLQSNFQSELLFVLILRSRNKVHIDFLSLVNGRCEILLEYSIIEGKGIFLVCFFIVCHKVHQVACSMFIPFMFILPICCFLGDFRPINVQIPQQLSFILDNSVIIRKPNTIFISLIAKTI